MAVVEVRTVTYYCDTCGASTSTVKGSDAKPIRCWRSECPGDKPKTRLQAVRQGEAVSPLSETAA